MEEVVEEELVYGRRWWRKWGIGGVGGGYGVGRRWWMEQGVEEVVDGKRWW